jgi:hypothetical protein
VKEVTIFTYMTIKTVLTTTLCTPPLSTGVAMRGRDSLTIMLARSRVTSSKWPFWRTGLIFAAYLRWRLVRNRRGKMVYCKGVR